MVMAPNDYEFHIHDTHPVIWHYHLDYQLQQSYRQEANQRAEFKILLANIIVTELVEWGVALLQRALYSHPLTEHNYVAWK